MIEKIKIKYNNLNGSSYEESKFSSNQDGLSNISPLDLDAQSNISSNQDVQSNILYLKEILNEQFLKINDEFMVYIKEIFDKKLINDDDLVSYNFLKYKKFNSFEITDMIYLLINDKNYENQLLNDFDNIEKINCLLEYSRQNFIPNQITDVFSTHFENYNYTNCKLDIDNKDIKNFQKYYKYIDIENKYCLMLFDKLPLTHKSYNNKHEMILENKDEMFNEALINELSSMADRLYEKKNFLIYIYILHKYFKEHDIHYKFITDYYFTDYSYEENLKTNNGFNNLLEKMINNQLFLEIVKLIKALCDNYFFENIELMKNDNYEIYKGVIKDEFDTIDNTLDNFDDLLGKQKKKYNTIIDEKIERLKKYNIFYTEDDINKTQDDINKIITYFYTTYIFPSENKPLINEYKDYFDIIIEEF